MTMPKQILVVISGKRKEHEALERALKFDDYGDIHIHLFNSIYEPVLELTDVLSSEHRKEMKRQYLADRTLYMKSIAEELYTKGIKCSVRVEWHRELHEIIEQVVDELKPDLVIKRISADPLSINPFALPTDRHLIRYCQAPLLLVKHAQWSQDPILAAVDVLATDSQHRKLNQAILESANSLAQLNKTDLHVVNSFITYSVSSGIDLPMINLTQLNKNSADYHRNKLSKLLLENNIDGAQMHLLNGSPESTIPQAVKQIKPQLVVLGTVGRTGITAALLGNTAEAILAELDCEILALKP